MANSAEGATKACSDAGDVEGATHLLGTLALAECAGTMHAQTIQNRRAADLSCGRTIAAGSTKSQPKVETGSHSVSMTKSAHPIPAKLSLGAPCLARRICFSTVTGKQQIPRYARDDNTSNSIGLAKPECFDREFLSREFLSRNLPPRRRDKRDRTRPVVRILEVALEFTKQFLGDVSGLH